MTESGHMGLRPESWDPGKSADSHSDATQLTIKGAFFLEEGGFCLGKEFLAEELTYCLFRRLNITILERSSQLKIKGFIRKIVFGYIQREFLVKYVFMVLPIVVRILLLNPESHKS